MNELVATIGRWLSQLMFWIAVAPWEQALRVRCGRHVKVLGPGFYGRIPLLDVVYLQSVRVRSCLIATQTLSTSDGHTLIVGGALSYSVADIGKLYDRLHHAEDTLRTFTGAALAEHVQSTARALLKPDSLASAATAKLHHQLEQCGLTDVEVSLTDFAFVRTYRLVQDGRYQSHNDPLDTSKGLGA
jgi:hypothetical protein